MSHEIFSAFSSVGENTNTWLTPAPESPRFERSETFPLSPSLALPLSWSSLTLGHPSEQGNRETV